MGKQKHKKGKAAAAQSKSSKVPYQLILVVAVVVAAIVVYFYGGRDISPEEAARLAGDVLPGYTSRDPALRNRLILPAIPHATRPITLPPESFADDETRRAYQAAKDYPEVLETIACYCGCYGSFGHRNNLDCHKDNHTVT